MDSEVLLKTVKGNPDKEAERQVTDLEIDMHDSVMQSIGSVASVTKRPSEAGEPVTDYKVK